MKFLFDIGNQYCGNWFSVGPTVGLRRRCEACSAVRGAEWWCCGIVVTCVVVLQIRDWVSAETGMLRAQPVAVGDVDDILHQLDKQKVSLPAPRYFAPIVQPVVNLLTDPARCEHTCMVNMLMYL